MLAPLARLANPSAIRNCSAVRNKEDFRGLWERTGRAQDLLDIIMFSGETSGPIACVVEKDSAAEVLELLVNRGFAAAVQIGYGRRCERPKVIIE